MKALFFYIIFSTMCKNLVQLLLVVVCINLMWFEKSFFHFPFGNHSVIIYKFIPFRGYGFRILNHMSSYSVSMPILLSLFSMTLKTSSLIELAFQDKAACKQINF